MLAVSVWLVASALRLQAQQMEAPWTVLEQLAAANRSEPGFGPEFSATLKSLQASCAPVQVGGLSPWHVWKMSGPEGIRYAVLFGQMLMIIPSSSSTCV